MTSPLTPAGFTELHFQDCDRRNQVEKTHTSLDITEDIATLDKKVEAFNSNVLQLHYKYLSKVKGINNSRRQLHIQHQTSHNNLPQKRFMVAIRYTVPFNKNVQYIICSAFKFPQFIVDAQLSPSLANQSCIVEIVV